MCVSLFTVFSFCSSTSSSSVLLLFLSPFSTLCSGKRIQDEFSAMVSDSRSLYNLNGVYRSHCQVAFSHTFEMDDFWECGMRSFFGLLSYLFDYNNRIQCVEYGFFTVKKKTFNSISWATIETISNDFMYFILLFFSSLYFSFVVVVWNAINTFGF